MLRRRANLSHSPLILILFMSAFLAACGQGDTSNIMVAEIEDRVIMLDYFERKMNTISPDQLPGDVTTHEGRMELLEARMPLSVLEIVETLLTQEIDLEISIYRSDPVQGFAAKPAVTLDLHAQIDLETTSLDGFTPSVDVDMNSDGGRDRVSSAGGDAIEVDARPSDAIALAVHLAAPIFVEKAVLEEVLASSNE